MIIAKPLTIADSEIRKKRCNTITLLSSGKPGSVHQEGFLLYGKIISRMP